MFAMAIANEVGADDLDPPGLGLETRFFVYQEANAQLVEGIAHVVRRFVIMIAENGDAAIRDWT